jgi:DNA-binding LacI/PurR family transcriptional regulator
VRGDWTAASGHAAVARFGDEVTALFAANDQMALGALRALSDRGRRVPDDVAVVGFDDVADAADYRPPLTTIRQDFDALGAAAIDALVARLAGAAVAPVVLVPELIRRASA